MTVRVGHKILYIFLVLLWGCLLAENLVQVKNATAL
jgi:hypothetical protein